MSRIVNLKLWATQPCIHLTRLRRLGGGAKFASSGTIQTISDCLARRAGDAHVVPLKAFMKKIVFSLTIFGLILSACATTKLEAPVTLTPSPSNAINLPAPSRESANDFPVTMQAGKTQNAAYFATMDSKLTQVSVAQKTAKVLTPSVTPRPTRTSTPTLSATQYLAWSTFQSDEYGIAFEFPLYFDLPPYDCGPHISSGENGAVLEIGLGYRIWISGTPFEQSQVNLSQYLEQRTQELEAGTETRITAITWGYVGGERAVTVEFRFGSLNRYGIQTFFVRDNLLYTATFTAGGTCDFLPINPENIRLSEFEAYWHMLSTWRFLD